MGIDPVTHQRLDRQSTKDTSLSTVTIKEKSDENQMPMNESSQENLSPPEDSSNCSSDDPLASCLWEEDMSLIDASWKFPSSEEDYWEDGSQWLLDYQNYGRGDLGLDEFPGNSNSPDS